MYAIMYIKYKKEVLYVYYKCYRFKKKFIQLS